MFRRQSEGTGDGLYYGLNGIFADFSPKPLENEAGNGFHINMSVKSSDGKDHMDSMIAGILDKISDMTVFLNPTADSYRRFGCYKAPKYISWSSENRSQLIRVPAAIGRYRRWSLLRSERSWNCPRLPEDRNNENQFHSVPVLPHDVSFLEKSPSVPGSGRLPGGYFHPYLQEG